MSKWCSSTYLDLNARKTRELVFDNRQKQNVKDPVSINAVPVKFESEYMYLGVVMQNNLKLEAHLEMLMEKANKRMYCIRRLKKREIDK